MSKKENNDQESKPVTTNTEISLDLSKLMLPISIVLAGLMISTGLFFGLRAGGGSSSSSACNAATPFSRDCLVSYAKEIKLNTRKFEQCLDDKKFEAAVNSDYSYGEELGVGGTPSLYFGKGSGDTFQGFSIGAGVDMSTLSQLISFAKGDVTMQEVSQQWKEIQLAQLPAFEQQVRDYYTSSQGGSLQGEQLEQEVKLIMDQRRSTIEQDATVVDLRKGDGMEKGGGDIVIMEFSDYECPYCASFANGLLRDLESSYINSNQIRFIFRDFPLRSIHPNAQLAAEAARCAGDQGKYFEYHDKLFKRP
jgi:protein-disulfide isomerase